MVAACPSLSAFAVEQLIHGLAVLGDQGAFHLAFGGPAERVEPGAAHTLEAGQQLERGHGARTQRHLARHAGARILRAKIGGAMWKRRLYSPSNWSWSWARNASPV